MEQYFSIQQIFMSICYLLGSRTVRKEPIGAGTKEKGKQMGRSGRWRVEGVGSFRTMESLLDLIVPSGNYEKTLENLSLSVTGYDLHIEQTMPAAFESPEPVGCLGNDVQSCPIISPSLVR